MTDNIERAKAVLTENTRVPYGIFRLISRSDRFPPRHLLNEFLMSGSDLCDQDARMAPWRPFRLSPEEFEAVEVWWRGLHPRAITDALSATCWREWAVELIEAEDP